MLGDNVLFLFRGSIILVNIYMQDNAHPCRANTTRQYMENQNIPTMTGQQLARHEPHGKHLEPHEETAEETWFILQM